MTDCCDCLCMMFDVYVVMIKMMSTYVKRFFLLCTAMKCFSICHCYQYKMVINLKLLKQNSKVN